MTKDFLRQFNQLLYKVFFPLRLVYNIYTSDNLLDGNSFFLIFVVAVVTIIYILLMIFVPITVKEGPKRGPMVQGIMRSNISLFALPLAETILGDEGIAIASLLIAFVIAFYNVYSVIAFESFRGGKASIKHTLISVVKNPMIDGVVVGLFFNLLHIPFPGPLLVPLGKIAAVTSPMALIVLGGTLEFSAVKHNLKYILSVIGIKMVLLPLIVVPIAHAMGFNAPEIFGAYCLVGTPVATGTYVLAVNMGGDGDLAG